MNGRTPVLKKRAALPKCQVRRAEFNALYYVFIIDAIELQASDATALFVYIFLGLPPFH